MWDATGILPLPHHMLMTKQDHIDSVKDDTDELTRIFEFHEGIIVDEGMMMKKEDLHRIPCRSAG